ncbi:hypothetical protein F5B20DRAFT_584399 [Whalleya microplaca]|nr:hypothetical protein F5B20DRAFT_584399 [Whalleya microplaca]
MANPEGLKLFSKLPPEIRNMIANFFWDSFPDLSLFHVFHDSVTPGTFVHLTYLADGTPFLTRKLVELLGPPPAYEQLRIHSKPVRFMEATSQDDTDIQIDKIHSNFIWGSCEKDVFYFTRPQNHRHMISLKLLKPRQFAMPILFRPNSLKPWVRWLKRYMGDGCPLKKVTLVPFDVPLSRERLPPHETALHPFGFVPLHRYAEGHTHPSLRKKTVRCDDLLYCPVLKHIDLFLQVHRHVRSALEHRRYRVPVEVVGDCHDFKTKIRPTIQNKTES